VRGISDILDFRKQRFDPPSDWEGYGRQCLTKGRLVGDKDSVRAGFGSRDRAQGVGSVLKERGGRGNEGREDGWSRRTRNDRYLYRPEGHSDLLVWPKKGPSPSGGDKQAHSPALPGQAPTPGSRGAPLPSSTQRINCASSATGHLVRVNVSMSRDGSKRDL